MRLDDIRESDNVEDRRGMQMPGGRGGLGLGTIVILGIIGYALGIDPRILIGGAEMLGVGTGSGPQTEQQGAPPGNDQTSVFLRRIVALNEDVWSKVLPEQGGPGYTSPTLVIFSGATQSGCGVAQSAMGPFYCPVDKKVYLDTSFFQEMKRKLGGGGDFAYAYVVAHEVGHHIQDELGLLSKVQNAQRALGSTQSNELQVRVELQADCYAGVWANHADERFKVLQPGDVQEAINSASAIGDDRLQRQAQGYVVPDSFTHGTSAQRVNWFMTGLKTGQLRACNTFSNSN